MTVLSRPLRKKYRKKIQWKKDQKYSGLRFINTRSSSERTFSCKISRSQYRNDCYLTKVLPSVVRFGPCWYRRRVAEAGIPRLLPLHYYQAQNTRSRPPFSFKFTFMLQIYFGVEDHCYDVSYRIKHGIVLKLARYAPILQYSLWYISASVSRLLHCQAPPPFACVSSSLIYEMCSARNNRCLLDKHSGKYMYHVF
jgi:hypothetical protein